MQTLGEALQERMGSKTQIEFAEELGIAQSTLSEILSGKRMLGLNRAAAAIVRAYPELSALFLPENIAIAKEECDSEQDDAAAVPEEAECQ